MTSLAAMFGGALTVVGTAHGSWLAAACGLIVTAAAVTSAVVQQRWR